MGLGQTVLNMYKIAKYYKKDNTGNHWYLQELLSGKGESLRRILKKHEFDMMDVNDKAIALNVCTPLSIVIHKAGSLFANGRYYVMDADGNESTQHDDIRMLLKHPNVLQSGKQFSKQIEMSLKLFGFCPVYTLRATATSLPKAMWIIPPELFKTETSGKMFNQTDLSEIISSAYIEWGSERIMLYPEDYFIIYDSEAIIRGDKTGLSFRSPTDALSVPVTGWVSQAIASNTLIVNGGPKGIIHGKGSDINTVLSPEEQNELNENFKSKYGLVGKAFSILVTKAELGWLPLDYKTRDLMLHEEDVRCSNKIINAIGLNPNVFNSDSKYENQEAAERKAYQGLIIPDAENVCEALTSALCPEGIYITLDYSHIDCLQADKKDAAVALKSINDAVSGLYNNGIITVNEARVELAKYIDINPDKPVGEFKAEQNEVSNENNNEDGTDEE